MKEFFYFMGFLIVSIGTVTAFQIHNYNQDSEMCGGDVLYPSPYKEGYDFVRFEYENGTKIEPCKENIYLKSELKGAYKVFKESTQTLVNGEWEYKTIREEANYAE